MRDSRSEAEGTKSDEDRTTPAKPIVVGRYALCGELGSGGMGTVHVGRLAGPLGFARTVAIKRMHRHFAGDPVFTRLFLDEARLAARVAHANVVSTLDVVSEGDELLVVLEYITGGSLAAILRAIGKKGARLPTNVVGTILSQTLHGLHAVHEARDEDGKALGLIHRDVAPDNILVGTDGVARVIDFGIAKATELGRRTADNKLKGKLRYMAPEHLRGDAIDRRADVYAAGSVLFEAITGRYLLQGANEVEQIANYQSLDVSKKRPSAFVSSASEALDALLLKALAFDREKRFQTALEMARAVESEFGLAPPSTVAEFVERMLTSELSRRRELVERAIASTKALRPADDDPTRKHDPVHELTSEPSEDPGDVALETRDLEVVDLAALEPNARHEPALSPTMLSPTSPYDDRGAKHEETTAKRQPGAVSMALPDLAPLEQTRPSPRADLAIPLDRGPAPPTPSSRDEVAADEPTQPRDRGDAAAHPVPPRAASPAAAPREVVPRVPFDRPPTALSTPPNTGFQWSFLIPVGVIALAVAAFVLLRGDDTPKAADATAGTRPPSTPASQDCDTMRLRVKSGGQPLGLSRRGWTLDFWYRSKDPSDPPAAELDALAGGSTIVVEDLRAKNGPADGRVVSISGDRADLAFDYDRYSALFVAADRFFDVVKADQAALVLRCAHLSYYDTGVWFRARSLDEVTASMIMLFGLFNDVPLLDMPPLEARETPFLSLSKQVTKAALRDPAIVLQKQGGTVEKKDGFVRATFAPANLGTVLRATRSLMEESGIKGR